MRTKPEASSASPVVDSNSLERPQYRCPISELTKDLTPNARKAATVAAKTILYPTER